MIAQSRIKLNELGPLKQCGIKDDTLAAVSHTGQELKTFLDGYVAENPGSEGWPQWKNQQTNHLLFPILCSQTQDHCSFCDGHPMKNDMTAETIEHFRPKAGPEGRPALRLTWKNLFACCSGCQSAKGQKWDRRLLKPDVRGYSFRKYFSCEFSTGKIVPRPRASKHAKKRAEVTIEFYDLNRFSDQRLNMVEKHPWYGPAVPRDMKRFRYWADALEKHRPKTA